jgi:hypothetical protein
MDSFKKGRVALKSWPQDISAFFLLDNNMFLKWENHGFDNVESFVILF